MPCYDGLAEEYRHRTARAACEMAKLLKLLGFDLMLSQETLNWIEEHEKFDCEREKEKNHHGT